MTSAAITDRTANDRTCICGHDIREHEDYEFNIHECTHSGCDCKQFKDVEAACNRYVATMNSDLCAICEQPLFAHQRG